MLRFVFGLVLAVSGCRTSGALPSSTPDEPGCPSPPPSYRSEVLPVLREKCFSCHAGSGDEAEDYDLSAFKNVHAQRLAIFGKVRARAMPPAGQEPLTDTERRKLLAWLSCQAPDN